MLTAWPSWFTALVAGSTSSTGKPATKRLERRLPMEVSSAIARMDLLSDNQMKKARSKLTFVPQESRGGHVTQVWSAQCFLLGNGLHTPSETVHGRDARAYTDMATYWIRSFGVVGRFPARAT